ncbi:MAG TPA: hypothetical protein VKA60_17480 [Blastocatellia bacterium]|nr:hypothetical protein [Blastocatellia bacterium]
MSLDADHRPTDANGIIEEALAESSKAWCVDDQYILLFVIQRALRRMGNSARAREVNAMALAAARQIESPYCRTYRLVQVSDDFAACGDAEAAKAAALEAFAAAREEPDPNNGSGVLGQAVTALLRVGEVDQAVAAAEMITNPWTRTSAFNAIAQAKGHIGDKAKAGHRPAAVSDLATIEKLGDDLMRAHSLAPPQSRIYAYVGIAWEMAEAGLAYETKRAVDAALPLVRESEESVYTPMSRCFPERGYRTRTLTRLAECLVKVGYKREAKMIALEALVGARDPDTFDKLEDKVPALAAIAEVLHDCYDE